MDTSFIHTTEYALVLVNPVHVNYLEHSNVWYCLLRLKFLQRLYHSLFKNKLVWVIFDKFFILICPTLFSYQSTLATCTRTLISL